jgi:hypothetical protein
LICRHLAARSAGTFVGSDGATFSFVMTKTEFSWEMSKTQRPEEPGGTGEKIGFTAFKAALGRIGSP